MKRRSSALLALVHSCRQSAYILDGPLTAALGFRTLRSPHVVKGDVRAPEISAGIVLHLRCCSFKSVSVAGSQRPCVVDPARIKADDVKVLRPVSLESEAMRVEPKALGNGTLAFGSSTVDSAPADSSVRTW